MDVLVMFFSAISIGTLDVVLLDFFLGEQPHSLQLLQLRDSLFNPLLDDLRHLVLSRVPLRLLFTNITVINVDLKLKYRKTIANRTRVLPHTCVELVWKL